MSTEPNSLPATLERILVVRFGAMGDVIHALPAVTALRRAYPDAFIGWVIEERWVELLSARANVATARSRQKPLIDRIHEIDTRAWRAAILSDETWKEIVDFFRGLRQASYEVAIDFQGAWKSALTAQLSGAPSRLGFRQPRERGASVFYTHQVSTVMPHVIQQNCELIAPLIGRGATAAASSSPVLPLDEAVDAWCERTLAERRLQSRPFAIINPGAGWGAKCWPAEKYAEVARGLSDAGVASVVNFAPGEEALARQVESLSGGTAVAIACSVGELVALTRRARLFIGGDTGPLHLAAALQVPVVGIFGPTDPVRNGPFAAESVVLRRALSVTNHSRRAGPDEAMLGIPAAEVLSAALGLLERTASRRRSIVSEARDA